MSIGRTATPRSRPAKGGGLRSRGALGLVLWATALPALAIPLDRLASPRPAHWVLDTTGTLSVPDVAQLDAAAEAARARTGGEIAVVILDSTDGRPPHDDATSLANRWLLGDQVRRNGVLLLLAKNDRRAEIALGKGIDDEGQRAVAQQLLEQEIVPRFKQGDWVGGLLAGVRAIDARILSPTTGASERADRGGTERNPGGASVPAPGSAAQSKAVGRRQALPVSGLVVGGLVALGILLLIARRRGSGGLS